MLKRGEKMTVQYSQDELCEHIANGKSLVSWCKKTGIGYSTIAAHLAKDLEFQEKYTRAREAQADYLADEVIEISDDSGLDARIDPQSGKPVVDGEAIQRAKLRVDSRKWAASKMKPKKYGDRVQQDVQHLDSRGKPTNPPAALPAHVVAKLDDLLDNEF